jgi:uncharacterized protein
VLRQPLAIEAFGAGGFRVAGVWRPGSLLIFQDAPRDWQVAALADLGPEDLHDVMQAPRGAVEFVLLGTGSVQGLPPRSVREALRGAGLGLEFMATEAAVRLHNILASEGRLFATALIAL